MTDILQRLLQQGAVIIVGESGTGTRRRMPRVERAGAVERSVDPETLAALIAARFIRKRGAEPPLRYEIATNGRQALDRARRRAQHRERETNRVTPPGEADGRAVFRIAQLPDGTVGLQHGTIRVEYQTQVAVRWERPGMRPTRNQYYPKAGPQYAFTPAEAVADARALAAQDVARHRAHLAAAKAHAAAVEEAAAAIERAERDPFGAGRLSVEEIEP